MARSTGLQMASRDRASRQGMAVRLLVLFAMATGACSTPQGADAGPDAPPCPSGGQVFELEGVNNDYAVCGGDCTRVHGSGECAPGYVCTCSTACVWFERFPLDGGGSCEGDASYAPPDSALDAPADAN